MGVEVVVPFDGSSRALSVVRLCAELSAVLDGRLSILTSGDVGTGKAMEGLRGRAADLSDENLEVVLGGGSDPATAVATAVATSRAGGRAPVVAMATHARKGLGRTLLGGVAESVLVDVDAPVLLFGPKCAIPEHAAATRVIACVDGPATADQIVELAGWVAGRFGLPSMVVHVRSGSREAGDGGPGGDEQLDGQEMQRLADVAAGLAGMSESVEVAILDNDDVVAELVELAVAHPGAVLVMATHGRRGRERRKLGSVVMGVVARSPLPVLARRPRPSDG